MFPRTAAAFPQRTFVRGETNGDGVADLADVLGLLAPLLSGGGEIPCEDAADANDDGAIGIADAAQILTSLFRGEPLPPPVPPGCGSDPTEDRLGCRSPPARCRTVPLEEFAVPGFEPTGPDVPERVSEPIVVATAEELADRLARAVSGDVVYVADQVEIDLTGYGTLLIPGGVTLAGGRRALKEGGLIFTTNRAETRLLEVAGDYVRIAGLRFRGPSARKDRNQATAVAIYVPRPHWVSIDNNEFYNWPGSGVQVWDITTEGCVVEADRQHHVRIARNFFHHNQGEGLGYGIWVAHGGFPYIVANTFDQNRHDIAADGRPRTGYRAHLNMVLSGGGRYCNPELVCWYEHHFDVHGRGVDFQGGIAGEWVEIAYNTFLAGGGDEPENGKRAAFHLRGTPCDTASFHHNVVAHEPSVAVRNDSEADNFFEHDNQYAVDTTGDFGRGDFDGDAVDDVFTATGAAWYYSSGGRSEWRYLRASPNRLRSLLIADFGGNRIADVFTTRDGDWLLSRDGVDPWIRINRSEIAMEGYRAGDFNGDGKTDIFRADGSRWYISWAATSVWEPVAISRHTVDDLRFGDFNGDGKTDVFGLANGQWSVSWEGRSMWQQLNNVQWADIGRLVFADFDGNRITDIGLDAGGRWLVSWGSAGAFEFLNEVSPFPHDRLEDLLLGDFDGKPGADVLRYEVIALAPQAFLRGERFVLSSAGAGPFRLHSRHNMR